MLQILVLKQLRAIEYASITVSRYCTEDKRRGQLLTAWCHPQVAEVAVVVAPDQVSSSVFACSRVVADISGCGLEKEPLSVYRVEVVK